MKAPGQGPLPVTFLLEDLDFGGTQGQTLELAARLDRERFCPRLVTLRKGNMDFAGKAEALALPWLSLTDYAGEFRPLCSLPALLRHLRLERPPLLQLLTVLPNIWGRVMGAALRLPGIIGCCRGEAAVKGQHERFLGAIPDALIANSRSIAERLAVEAKVGPEKIFFIANGLDMDFFAPAPSPAQSPDMVCVARLVPAKNHALLLQAFARVLSSMPEARLHLVGEGCCEADLRRLAAELDLSRSLFFHRPLADVRPFLHKARIFVLASDHEGTPNALLEAMACALPVAATAVGGNTEAVEHGKSGLLTPAGDVEALARAMLDLLRHPEQGLAFGLAGRQRVLQNYSMSAMVRAHEELYDFVLKKADGESCQKIA